MPLRRLLLVSTLALTLAAIPQSASGQVAGEDQGVTVKRGSHGYFLHFSKRAAKTYRRIAGRRIAVECSAVTPSVGNLVVEGGGTDLMRAPRRRGRIDTFTRGRIDFCSVRLRRRGGGELIAAAPVTAAGRRYLDELLTAHLLMVPFILHDDAETPASTTQMVADGRGLIVALDGPEGAPPRERIGYWTDGVRVVVAAVTETGRRLFFETERDVITTNALSYLNEG